MFSIRDHIASTYTNDTSDLSEHSERERPERSCREGDQSEQGRAERSAWRRERPLGCARSASIPPALS